MYVQGTPNCGTFFLNGVREFNPRTSARFFTGLRNACDNYTAGRRWHIPGCIIFSDARRTKTGSPTKGDLLAKAIRNKKLGYVTAGNYTKNPNTNRWIKCWVWNVNETALRNIR